MVQRIITTIFILLLVVPALVFGGAMLELLKALIIFFGSVELLNLTKDDKLKTINYIFAGLITFAYFFDNNFSTFAPMTTILLIVSLLLPVFMEKVNAKWSIFALVAIFLLSTFANSFTLVHAYHVNLVWLIIISTYVCDTFAYFVGRKFGKHKLLERISPKKTIEGSIGGYIAAVIIGLAFSYFFVSGTTLQLILVCFGTPIISQLGDLAFSAMKRTYGIKDFSNLLPGHGGVLDRLDSLIFSIMYVSIIIMVI